MVERGEAEGLENVLWTCRSEIQGGGKSGHEPVKTRFNHLPAEKGIRVGLEVKSNKFRGIIEKRSQKGKFGVSFLF